VRGGTLKGSVTSVFLGLKGGGWQKRTPWGVVLGFSLWIPGVSQTIGNARRSAEKLARRVFSAYIVVKIPQCRGEKP